MEVLIERCSVTGNPVGTDTWVAGEACTCDACRRFVLGVPYAKSSLVHTCGGRKIVRGPVICWACIANASYDAVPVIDLGFPKPENDIIVK